MHASARTGTCQIDVPRRGGAVRLFRGLLIREHDLERRNTVGENHRYLVRNRLGRSKACALFGSAAWSARIAMP